MNLDLGGPGPGCSALRVRRLLAGELSGVEKERTEAHVTGCERCAAVREEIAAEREALRRDVPFPQFAAGVAEKLAHRPRRDFVSRWAPLAAAAGLLLVAGTALVGYVIWVLRTGALLASALAGLPVWRFLDPLPGLENWRKRRPEEEEAEAQADTDESIRKLESMFNGVAPDTGRKAANG